MTTVGTVHCVLVEFCCEACCEAGFIETGRDATGTCCELTGIGCCVCEGVAIA